MMTFDRCPRCGTDPEGCTCPATLPFQGGRNGQTAPQTPCPPPGEGDPILGPQNGVSSVDPWPHTSAMIRERDRTTEDSWLSLLHTRSTTSDLRSLVQQLAVGDAMETVWDAYFAPTHPAAFTRDAAGRLTLRTGGER